jgi:acetyltransferase
MTVRNLEKLFRPTSIAVIGASDRAGSIGAVVTRNLLAGGFAGPVYPVNPKHTEIAGRRAYASVSDLPQTPDLAVIATPPQTIPPLIHALGERGTRAAIVLSAGLSVRYEGPAVPDPAISGELTVKQAMLAAAKPYLLRILGPNCVGLLVPPLGLNASFAHTDARPGRLAFISQSGALTTALLDRAKSAGIGFSHFVSLGDAADVDFGDVIDYLATDPGTGAILLYIESISAARKFMSATRAASRNTPVMAVKVGRVAEGARAAASHTGALAGVDIVYDAALARAGILRVETTLDLFDAAAILAHVDRLEGDRLAIVTNGGGPGVMATDALIAGGGRLAQLAPATMAALDQALPSTWSRANPVDIIGDAPVERYVATLQHVLADPGADAVLFIHAPTAIVPSVEIARACVPVIQAGRRKVIACWLGGDGLNEARSVFRNAGIPVYSTPEGAVRSFLHLAQFFHNRRLLAETPPAMAEHFAPHTDVAEAIVHSALAHSTTSAALLSEADSKAVLAAYEVPVVETRIVTEVAEVGRAARELGFPVAVKIVSPDISHKSDVGGVALNIEDAAAAEHAAAAMRRRAQELRPQAVITGFTVQRMIRRGGAVELIVGATTDATFGPVLMFGHGGVAVEVIGDRAVALPPLNLKLARELVERTRVAKLLAGYRDQPPADLDAVYLTLVKIAQLIIDRPEIVELDINPLLADHTGVIALDARIKVAATQTEGEVDSTKRLAIAPYPQQLEEHVEVAGQRLLLRPIRPEDEPAHRALLERTDPEDIRTRFLHQIRSFAHPKLAGLTQIDYERQMAFIATAVEPDAQGQRETLGVVRAVADPDNEHAEFAVLVRSDFKGRGLGYALMEKIIRYCRARGIGTLWGEVLTENHDMLDLAISLGFRRGRSDHGVVKVTLPLAAGEERMRA